MGKKYIIDLNPDCVEGEYLRIPARIAGEEQWLVTKAALTPYTEPDLEQVRIEAYEKGYHTGYAKYLNKSYEDGLKDAWDAARKIGYGLKSSIVAEIFGTPYSSHIFSGYTATEAIEKIRQYEQEKEEIKIGNEVAFHHDDGRPDTVVVVTYIGQDGFIDGMDGRGTQYAHKNPKKWTKTGRDFPELVEVLKKMRGEQK